MKDWARGIFGLKNRRGKCEGPTRGDRRVKEPEWEMRRTEGGGGRRGKEPKWEMRRTGARGGTNGCLKRKVF